MTNVCYNTTTPTLFYVRERMKLYNTAINNEIAQVYEYYQNTFGAFPTTKYSQTPACKTALTTQEQGTAVLPGNDPQGVVPP